MTTSLTKGEKPARSRRFFNEWAGVFIFYIFLVACVIIAIMWVGYVIRDARQHLPPPVPPFELEIYIDTDTGVQYLTTSKGGITPLLKADGTPDLVPTK